MSTTSERLIEGFAAVATTDSQRNFVASLSDQMFPLQINNAARGYFNTNEINQVNDFAFDTFGQRSPEVATLTGQGGQATNEPIPEGSNPTGQPQREDFQSGAGENEFITVGPDYFATRFEAAPLPPGQVGPMPVTEVQVAPRYRRGDEYQLFTGLSTEQVALIQNQMIRAGVLEPSVTRFGVWDEASASAAKDVLGFANIQGVEVDEAMRILIDTPLPQEARRDFELQPFQRPNRTEIETDISDVFESRLFRKPTKAELADLADMWEERVRLSFDDSENRRYYEELLEQRRAEGGDPRELEGGRQALSELQPEESPQSVFERVFESRYGGTIDRNEGRDEARVAGQSLSGLFRFLGGGR